VPDSDTNEHSEQLRLQYNELAELAGMLAHEINNPLSVIRMNMDLLAEDFNEEPTKNRRAINKIDVVNRQCTRLENLLTDFLRFSRLQKLDLTPGDLNDQIERVLILYKPLADESRVEIIRFLDTDLPIIKIHAEMLQAALVNLVKNALEAMPDGGTLEVRTRRSSTAVALDLIDTGCGIDDSTAMNMFNAFYTTKNGGSGLGLPTARKIIEAHGGRISVQSAVGRGTQFTLEFPTLTRLS